jgi:NAD(P)H-hydrate repair Nnr-like enzyme with NAD(P)H-hydrate dehydratase domain
VQLVVHPEVASVVGAALPEALVLAWDHVGDVPAPVAERLEHAGAVIVGPGLDARAVETAIAVSAVVGDGLLVVDAQALPALADADLDRRGPRLGAPNPGEAADLFGEEPDDEADVDLAELAARVAGLIGGPTAVRGATTIVDDGTGHQWEERSSVPALGTPGSGDVLMGALGACIVRGVPLAAALGWAVALHAAAGVRLAQDRPVGFLASEVADALPAALVELGGT